MIFNATQSAGQVGYHFLGSDDPDRAGGAAGVAGKLASAAGGNHQGTGLGQRGDAADDDIRAGKQLADSVPETALEWRWRGSAQVDAQVRDRHAEVT